MRAGAGAHGAFLQRRASRSGGAAAAIRAKGGQATTHICDVSKPAEVEKMVKDVVAQFGQLDILVNNAGICPRISIPDMTEDMFDKLININMKSVFQR